MLRTSFAVAIACIMGVLVAVLVTTRDLNHTNSIFTDGVVQAEKVNSTTDIALTAGNELPTADATFQISLPQTLSVIAQLQNAQGTLNGLAEQLTKGSAVLGSADAPLATIIGEVVASNTQLTNVQSSFANINNLLQGGLSLANAISSQLVQTLALSKNIESKLHILGVLGGTV